MGGVTTMHLSAVMSGLRRPIFVGALYAALCSIATAQDNPYRIDKDRAIFARIEDDAPVASEEKNADEFAAYNDVLTFARQYPAAELESAARRDLGFKDLFHPIRKDYHLELVYFEGRLQRLRSIGPTKPMREAGIETLYEGWMFPKDQPNPICFLCTDLPPGLSPQRDVAKEKMDVRVGFAGYSFKLIRYESAEVQPKSPMQGKIRKAPLLMGRAPTLLANVSEPVGADWHNTFLPVVLGSILTLALCVFGLAMWYRQGDAAVTQALAQRRDENPF
jgi:hypothetical protein